MVSDVSSRYSATVAVPAWLAMPRISSVDRPSPAWLENDRFGTARVRSAKFWMWAARIWAPLSTVTLSGTLRTFSERFWAVTTTSSTRPFCTPAVLPCLSWRAWPLGVVV